jgi:hypothetical protein
VWLSAANGRANEDRNKSSGGGSGREGEGNGGGGNDKAAPVAPRVVVVQGERVLLDSRAGAAVAAVPIAAMEGGSGVVRCMG